MAKYKPKIVAVTGSVGKTSTKDAIAYVLSSVTSVRKSLKSHNSEIGIPLSVLGCENAWSNPFLWIKNMFEGIALILFPSMYPEWLVLEVGADRPGDIKSVVTWLKPNIAVITRIGATPVHVEFFGTPAELAREKGYLASAQKQGDILVLNYDDEQVRAMGEKSKADVMTFGFDKGAMLRASNDHLVYTETSDGGLPCGIVFKVDYGGNILPIRIGGAIGRQTIYAALAALAVGVSQGIPIIDILERLSTFEGPPGRLRLLAGIKDSLVIDDTYNSSPIALELALKTLDGMKIDGRKIAVLGDMMELGKYTIDAHKAAGFEAARTCDVLIAVGQRAKFIADGALSEGMKEDAIRYFDDAESAGTYLEESMRPRDLVLVKGSQYMRMERCVIQIMAQPERASELLARQEPEWQKR